MATGERASSRGRAERASRLKGRLPSRSERRAGGRPPSANWGRPARNGARPSSGLLLKGRRPSPRRASGRRPSPGRPSERRSGRPPGRAPRGASPRKRSPPPPSRRRSGRPPSRGPPKRDPSGRVRSKRGPSKRRSWRSWRSERPSRSGPSARHSPRALKGRAGRKGRLAPAPEPCPWSLRRSKRGLMADRQMGYGTASSSRSSSWARRLGFRRKSQPTIVSNPVALP